MGKGFYISKAVAVVGGIVAVGAVATVIALAVVYSQELAKNNENSPSIQPTDAHPPTEPTGGTPTGPTTAAPSNQPWDKYRLPKNLVPLSYEVTLWPRLTPDKTTGLYIFTGTTTVEFECVEETDLILIHSNKLNYTHFDNGQKATLQSLNGGTTPSINSSWLQTTTQYLVLELDAKLQKGQYRLHTEFTGELADDLGGFYRSEYDDGEGPKVIATTQMQPTDARKAFPCFDEPAMKAIFNITILHDNNTIALSNGQEISSTEVVQDGQTLRRTVFEPTVKMSTYLLAFIVSEFDYVEDASTDVKVRIYARKAAIAAGQGDYAKNITGPILKHFEDYFSIPYPLSKSDQIALPDFNAGAMENWGLITYRETALLYDEEYSSNSNKERIATIIGHELAHMWFGNLVTLRWWNDLWLNEGFASYIEYEGADSAEPDWGVKDLIVLGDVHRVFAVDALTSSHPLSSKEEDIQRPAQISELFDAISYSKGASVLRMLSDFLSEDIFKKGLTSYLKQFEYGDAIYQDLWDHLQEAADNSSLPLNVTAIMNTWVLQMGFPVVTINTTTGEVSQEHFLLDPEANVTTTSPYNYEWSVPIRWNINEADQGMMWLHSKSENNPNVTTKEDQWVLANVNLVGYYRVNYDDGNWVKLLNTLRDKHESIPINNRAQLIDDAFNLARAKIIPTVRALETTEYLGKERAYIPWKSAMNNLEYFDLMFDRSEVYGPLQDYLQNLVKPLYEYYENTTSTWTVVPKSHMDQYNQVNAIRLACKTGLPDCLAMTQKLFNDWMTTGKNTIHPNLRSTVYCNAIAAGGAAEWNFAWEHFKNMTIATEAEKIRAALACTKEPWLLNRYLEYTLDANLIRKQDATSTIVYIASNVIGQSLAWDFVRSRWSYIYTQYGGGSFSFSNLVNGVTERFSTDYELTQLLAFKNENADVGFGSGTLAVEQSIERTIGNMKWLEENKQNVLTWLEGKNGKKASY
ncbi:aminopeptidase Ey-like [Nelusetta ayraudi]|uniref:aminopeptidase Ey-like n=1 Tax=Nelusetta ayraudi TaxID=303726 RepID=UPI003F71284B